MKEDEENEINWENFDGGPNGHVPCRDGLGRAAGDAY